MYLFCYGTRPELIKLIPLINAFKKNNIEYMTLFSGQHEELINDFYDLVDRPNIILRNIMEKNQSLNKLMGKIIIKMEDIYSDYNFDTVIIQGDTTTAMSIAISAFNQKKKIIHIEAGLRTNNKSSPFPEEMNRNIISKIVDIHFCPTSISVNNLKKENIIDNVFLVGNTIVDIFSQIEHYNNVKEKNYILVTLHRRENRGKKMINMWEQLNELAKRYNIYYITHPSLPESINILKNIKLLQPQNYINMVSLINNSIGIITDSGGLQEEAVCAGKKVLICRDTTERPETINTGYGKLINNNIINNIDFLFQSIKKLDNPYGKNVCEKIIKILKC